MLGAYFHVELNGVKYRLAEDAEGEHYIDHGDPLRNQTFAVVEGDSTGRFQMRPDLKVWSWADWSGGEGQFKYDPQAPGRYWKGNIINPFYKKGTLQVGPATQLTTEVDASAAAFDALFVKSGNELWGVELDSGLTTVHWWDNVNEGWKVAVHSRAASPGATAACSDHLFVYIKEAGTDDIYQFNPATQAFVLWNTDTTVTAREVTMATIGKYIYLYNPATCKVYEIPKTGTPPVASSVVYDLSDEGGMVVDMGKGQVADAHNRLYITQIVEEDTVVHEITPSNAAAEGFGREIARLEGFVCEAITFHLGFIYLIGKNTADTTQDDIERQILYLQPSGEYGTLGILRQDENDSSLPSVGEANTMLTTHFVARMTSANEPLLFVIDAIDGGIACLSRFDYAGADTVIAEDIAQYRGEIFWSTDDDATNQEVHRTMRGKYYDAADGDCFVISPVWDFGLAEDKILQSLRLYTEPLPANWTVEVDYQLDQSGTWVELVSHTGTGLTEKVVVASTDTSTLEFSNLQLRIRMWYGGAGVPTTTPVILGLESWATVNAAVRAFDIIVDLTDEDGQAQNRSWNGSTLRQNIITAVQDEGVVDFKDGYGDRNPGVYEQYDVRIDSWNIVLTHPGEGYAHLRLVVVL